MGSYLPCGCSCSPSGPNPKIRFDHWGCLYYAADVRLWGTSYYLSNTLTLCPNDSRLTDSCARLLKVLRAFHRGWMGRLQLWVRKTRLRHLLFNKLIIPFNQRWSYLLASLVLGFIHFMPNLSQVQPCLWVPRRSCPRCWIHPRDGRTTHQHPDSNPQLDHEFHTWW